MSENVQSVYSKRSIVPYIPSIIMLGLFLSNISTGLSFITLSHQIISLAVKIPILLSFLSYAPIVLKRNGTRVFFVSVIVLFFGVVNLCSYVFLNRDDTFFINTFFTFLTQCFPVLLISASTLSSDEEELFKNLTSFSYIIAIIACVALTTSMMNMSFFSIDGYSMGLGYSCTLPVIVLLADYSKRNNKLSLLLAIGTVAFIMLFCSRGSIIGIALYYVFISYKTIKESKKYLKAFFTILVIAIILVFSKEITQFIYNTLLDKGINSRTLYLLLNDISHDSNRSEIYLQIWSEIKEHPFSFRGISSDYLSVGIYTHNIILELIFEFGLLLSIPIFIFLAVLIRMTFKSKSKLNVMAIFFFASLPGLFVSGSLWINNVFWIWIGLTLRECSSYLHLKVKKEVRINENTPY